MLLLTSGGLLPTNHSLRRCLASIRRGALVAGLLLVGGAHGQTAGEVAAVAAVSELGLWKAGRLESFPFWGNQPAVERLSPWHPRGPLTASEPLGNAGLGVEGTGEGGALIDELPLPDLAGGEIAEGAAGPGLLPPMEADEGTATIQGEVYAASGEGLPGVMVTIPSLDRSTRTDQNGLFTLSDLPGRELIVKFNKLGYIVEDRTVVLKDEERVEISQALEEQPVEFDDGEYELDEVEVLGEYVEETANQIEIESFGESNILGGALGKAEFTKAGVADAAGAVSKIAGANVVGGQFVVVRGLGDRYNNTTLNGGIVPSPETSRKAVQLDLFPTDLLEEIAIAKTFAPNLPGDFVGGLVALQTLKVPEEDYFKVAVSTQYDAVTHEHGQFFTVPGLELPNNLQASDPVIRGDAILDSSAFTDTRGSDAQAARQRFFDEVKYNRIGRNPEMDRGLSIGFGKTYELADNNRFSIVGSFTYDTQDRYRREEVSRWGGNLPIPADQVSLLDPRFADLSSLTPPAPNGSTFTVGGLDANYERDIYTESKRAGLLLGGTLELGDNHQINASLFKFKSAQAEYTTTQGGVVDAAQWAEQVQILAVQDFTVIGGRFLDDEEYEMRSHRETYELLFRDLQFFQFGGSHNFEELGHGLELDWNLYKGSTAENRPRSYELNGYDITPVDGTGPAGFTIGNITNFSISPASVFIESSVEDESFQMKFDGRWTVLEPLSESRALDVVFGVGRYDRTRNSQLTQAAVELGRRARRSGDGGIAATEDILSGNPTVDDDRDTTSFNPIASRAGSDSTPQYTGSSAVTSFYLGTDAKWDEWFGAVGFRVEQETRAFEVPSDNSPTGGGNSSDLFPQVYFGRTFGYDDEFKVEFSFSNTVVRPTFYEFIPADIADVSNDQIFRGNRNLRESSSRNLDVRLTWDNQKGDSVGATVFHKVISDPIFTIRDPLENDILTFVNMGDTTVAGLELDATKKLWSGLSLTGNLSYIEGSAEPALVRQGSNEFLGQFDRLEGQPTWLGNLILSYENKDDLWNANLVYNYTGDFQTVGNLGRVGDPGFGGPSEIRQPFKSLDFNLSKTFENDWATCTLRFTIRNLLNSEEEVRFDGVDDSVAPRSKFAVGRSFGVSLGAQF